MASEDGGCRACADLTAAEFVRLVASMEGVAVAKVPEPPLGIVPGDVLRDLEGPRHRRTDTLCAYRYPTGNYCIEEACRTTGRGVNSGCVPTT